jgi:hypothetical protein
LRFTSNSELTNYYNFKSKLRWPKTSLKNAPMDVINGSHPSPVAPIITKTSTLTSMRSFEGLEVLVSYGVSGAMQNSLPRLPTAITGAFVLPNHGL